MKKPMALALLLACSACGTQPVLLSVPLNRFESPERGVQFELAGAISTESYLVLTPDQQTQAPDPAHADVGDCPQGSDDFFSNEHCGPPLSMRAGLSADAVQFALLDKGGIFTGQIKLHLFGPENHRAVEGDSSLAITAAYGRSNKEVGEGTPSTRIERTLRDVALILGHRIDNLVLLYGGPFYSEHRYEGSYTHVVQTQNQDDGGLLGGGGTTTSEEQVTDRFGGRLRVRGLNLGLRWQFGSQSRNAFFAECAYADFSGEGDPGSRGQCGLGLDLGFGS